MPFKKGETPKGAKPFQKGQSGNPKGRVVGSRNRSTVAKKWLETETLVANPITGKRQYLSLEDQITLAMIKQAIENGVPAAYKAIMDSRHGAPKQEIEHSGEVEIGFDISKLSDEDMKALLAIVGKTKTDA